MVRKKGNKGVIFALVFAILVIGVLIFLPNTQQSVLSLSDVKVEGGQASWVLTGTANNIDEGYRFDYNTQDVQVDSQTTIKPQKDLSLFISKEDSYCDYRTIEVETKVGVFPFRKDFRYFTLANPERVALIKITDANGESVIMDGTIVDSKTITDRDGKGKLTIQTQGIIAGKVDCPTNADVVLLDDGSIVNKDQMLSFISESRSFPTSINDIVNIITSAGDVKLNEQFISGFNSPPETSLTKVTGDVDIGNALFTITADQEYFDSVVFIQPKEVRPRINDINVPSEITQDQNSAMNVIISNREDSEGTIVVKVSSDSSTITPSSQNRILKDSLTLNFNIKTSSDVGRDTIRVEACSLSQFGETNCDSETKSYNIVVGETKDFCGDGVCQLTESETTCAEDCLITQPLDDLVEEKKCQSCEEFALSEMVGFILPGQKCEKNFLQAVVTCLGSFIKLALIPFIFLFGLLFGTPFFRKMEILKKNKFGGLIAGIISFVVAGILAILVYNLFVVGLIVAFIYFVVTKLLGKLK